MADSQTTESDVKWTSKDEERFDLYMEKRRLGLTTVQIYDRWYLFVIRGCFVGLLGCLCVASFRVIFLAGAEVTDSTLLNALILIGPTMNLAFAFDFYMRRGDKAAFLSFTVGHFVLVALFILACFCVYR